MRRLKTRYPGPGGMFAVSFLCHLVVFLLIAKFQYLPAFHPQEQQVTYVDLMTLPVASPRSGTPAPAAESATEAPAAPAAQAPPPPPAAPKKPEMALPSKTKPKPATAKSQPEKRAPAKTEPKQDEAKEFTERMAKLERQAEEKRQAEVLDRLRKKGGRTGMPGGKGTEVGSDYASYVQSRLRDAFSEVMTSQTKSPQTIVTITIGADGKIAEYHLDKSSGDPVFDDAVARAVTLAGRSLKPPPGGGQFKRMFRFKPEGVK
jgi:colicin import membrane protein